MDQSLRTFPLPIEPVRKHPRRRHRKRRKLGRFYLFLIFLWLRMVDATVLLFIYPRIPMIHRQELIGSVLATAVWTTVLLVAIWFRQNWAKYILICTFLLSVIFTLMRIPALPDVMNPRKDFFLIVGFTGAYFPIALVLIISKHIQKLTAPRFDMSSPKVEGPPGK